MGVYQEVDKDLDIESRYDRAKLAADSVKNDPAGSIGIYNDEMCESARFSERLLQDFHGALKEDRFKVYFQPRYDIRPDKPILCSAEALHADFEDIFYVDTLTDCYLEFYAESGRDLKIRPGGTDFYADIRQKLLPSVAGEDSQRMEEALKKENLRKLPGRGETLLVSFRRQRGTESVPYLLQAIRTRSSDDHHIMVGIRPEEMG